MSVSFAKQVISALNRLQRENVLSDIEDIEEMKKRFPNIELFVYSPDTDNFLKNVISEEYKDFIFIARKTDYPKDGVVLFLFKKNCYDYQVFFHGMNAGTRKDLWTHLGSVTAFMQTEHKAKKQKSNCNFPNYDFIVKDAIKLAKKQFDKTKHSIASLQYVPMVQVLHMNGIFYAETKE